MKKKVKGKKIKCEHCDKKNQVTEDVAKWICSTCVERSMQGVNLDDQEELTDTNQ